MCRQVIGIAILAVFCVQTAGAVDGISVEAGYGQDTTMLRVNDKWDSGKVWDAGTSWTAAGFLEAGVGDWRGVEKDGGHVWDIGVTPVIRLYSNQSNFFWEGGIGAHFLSNNRISERYLGKHFIFGIPVGFGWQFGVNEQYELGYRFQHLSNANTSSHNAAINFSQLRFGINY